MRTSFEFRHVSKRTNTALSLSLYFGKKTMMDFGAGSGRDCLTFAMKGFDVSHVDRQGCLTDFAKWRYQKRGLKVRIVDASNFREDKNTYDVITCFDVLEHIPDPMQYLEVFKGKLNKEGLLFIFADFDNLNTPLHLPENYEFQHHLDNALKELCFEKIADLGIQVWMKKS